MKWKSKGECLPGGGLDIYIIPQWSKNNDNNNNNSSLIWDITIINKKIYIIYQSGQEAVRLPLYAVAVRPSANLDSNSTWKGRKQRL